MQMQKTIQKAFTMKTTLDGQLAQYENLEEAKATWMFTCFDKLLINRMKTCGVSRRTAVTRKELYDIMDIECVIKK